MVASRIRLEQLVVQSVREPRQGMPIRRIVRSKGPFQGLPTQPRPDVGILSDILIIVEIDKTVMDNRIVDSERRNRQNEAEN